MTLDEPSTMLVEAAAKGCCNNEEWRGRLCAFHSGYEQGVEVGIDAYATLLEATHSDGPGPIPEDGAP